jgi:hypothetical protein
LIGLFQNKSLAFAAGIIFHTVSISFAWLNVRRDKEVQMTGYEIRALLSVVAVVVCIYMYCKGYRDKK